VSRSSVYFKRSVMVGWDAVSWVLALVAFLLVRHDLSLSERVWEAAVAYTVAAIVLQVIGGFRFHLYLGRSKIGSFDEATVLGSLVAGIAVILGLVFFITQPVFSRGLAVAMPSLAFLFMAAGRWVFRALRDGRTRRW
jgi:FlaA1/EpsC-like NDP-sugar epimerase